MANDEQIKKLSEQISRLEDEVKKEEEKINRSIEIKKEKARKLKEKVRKQETQQKIIIGGDMQKMFGKKDREEILKEIREMLELQAFLKANGIDTIDDLKIKLDGFNNDLR
ncbi:hypothetical protein J2W44_006108 [Priestia aryabhattai]|uniref:hypothetical protein n=1 Tax=Priestia aryabhattai TaxID=412384 RepID=UPI0027E3C33B|nr:hypothetical protein [Priestia aryabhattai]MDP9726952.1 hypothetical protein [Priestia aryabhattai]